MLLPMAAVIVVGVWAQAPGASRTAALVAIAARNRFMRSLRERIGAKLELHDLARRPLAALDVERRPGAVGRPQPFALPAAIRIVDAAVHPLGVEAHRIGNAQVHELAVHEGEQRLVGVAGGDRDALAEPERVELIDPDVVARLGAARLRHVLQLRAGEWIECPALGAVLPRGVRSIQRPLALAPVEAREMSARERCPGDAVPIDVHAAW